ncbi:hypothetical protein FQN54_007665 [Arachnomyces sp. PD_36]|nr:hypothetical protein FQN54_007665 [Arachnomyces sp. PD_36]
MIGPGAGILSNAKLYLQNTTTLVRPNVAAIEIVIQSNTDVSFPLHNNAIREYQIIFDFLIRNEL